MHSLRNSPPDCFSQMLTHLEPRVSCATRNSLGSKPPPYDDFVFIVGLDAHIEPYNPSVSCADSTGWVVSLP